MESLFRKPWYDHTPRSYYPREVPIQHPYSPHYYSFTNRDAPPQPQSARAPRVVSIPVQYAAPELRQDGLRSGPGQTQYAAPERRHEYLRSDAALKIQKVFRGYTVRKSVGKIAGIKREVEEISERVAKKETADLVRTDAKERLRVVETLMSLLLKLDSVKGVDSGVRNLRKAVIKKAIALQEKVEASAAYHQTPGGHESAAPESDSGLEASKQSGDTVVNGSESACNSSESKEESNDELLKKMAEENERMAGLVTELVHRNEKQTRLMGSLARRVEMLERALINERLRAKKKKRHALDCREEFF